MGLLLIHLRLSEKGYLPDVDDAYKTMYEAFSGIFCGLYILMFIWILVRNCVYRRLCSFSNFLYMFTSLGFISVGTYICANIGQEAYNMSLVMSQPCNSNATGLLIDFESTYAKAASFLCSDGCPCNLINKPENSTLTIDLMGAYNFEKCKNSTLAQGLNQEYLQLFRQMEQDHDCSGVCNNPGYFVFSNVNNGYPTSTC